jgi:hypothetical protein
MRFELLHESLSAGAVAAAIRAAIAADAARGTSGVGRLGLTWYYHRLDCDDFAGVLRREAGLQFHRVGLHGALPPETIGGAYILTGDPRHDRGKRTMYRAFRVCDEPGTLSPPILNVRAQLPYSPNTIDPTPPTAVA